MRPRSPPRWPGCSTPSTPARLSHRSGCSTPTTPPSPTPLRRKDNPLPTESLARKQSRPSSPEEILDTLRELIVEVIGADFLPEAGFGMQTSFTDDLCLESIQFVILAEQLRAVYGDD